MLGHDEVVLEGARPLGQRLHLLRKVQRRDGPPCPPLSKGNASGATQWANLRLMPILKAILSISLLFGGFGVGRLNCFVNVIIEFVMYSDHIYSFCLLYIIEEHRINPSKTHWDRIPWSLGRKVE